MLQDQIVIDTDGDEDFGHIHTAAVPRKPKIRLRERFLAAKERYAESFSGLAEWGVERFDVNVPAMAVSLAVHLAIVACLAITGIAVHREVGRHFDSVASSVDTRIDRSLEKMQFQDIDQSAERPNMIPAAGSFAPDLSTMTHTGQAGGPVLKSVEPSDAVSLARVDVQRATQSIVPTAMMLGQTVSIKGNGAEHVGSAEGAVDRIAEEILRQLEQGRTLVVWAFDASGSLQAERERLSKHIEAVYRHISQLDDKQLSADDALLTEVVAFGEDRKAMTPSPTGDVGEITKAIDAVKLDASGVESTFQTVATIVEKWGRYRDSKGRHYRTMIIVVTDEVGDDENYLETAIAAAQKAKVPVYVLGSQAIFARAEGRMNYTDPKTGQTYYNLPVRQGPESVVPEQIRLPFWFSGDQYDILDSGFGPYALSRLAGATDGIFFVTRLGQRRMGFDPQAMREYKPDWLSRPKYDEAVENNPIRKAVREAALITQQNNLPGMPSLVFPPVDAPEFKEAMERNQALTARVQYTVDAALEPIAYVVKMRDRETSRRWQAHYDLIRGRLMAMKVRAYEYNMACARMKKDPRKFTKPDSNAWRLVPDTEIHASDKAAEAGKQAMNLLEKVVNEHPNTPWALLAQREKKDPLGFKWVETHVPPIVRRDNNNAEAAARKKAQMNMPKPAPPPKL